MARIQSSTISSFCQISTNISCNHLRTGTPPGFSMSVLISSFSEAFRFFICFNAWPISSKVDGSFCPSCSAVGMTGVEMWSITCGSTTELTFNN
ncbi:unnamed protein product [Rotaria sp. Silwood2]|nr:unnamed protein product [Rotaria sp. Silwood2]